MTGADAISEIVQHLPRFVEARVAVVGDLMLDRFVYGAVERISPEAPIPVLRLDREVPMPGGASNVANNIAALGALPTLIGVVGEDAVAAELRTLLEAGGRIRSELLVEAGRRTTLKTRFIGQAQQLLRVDSETTAPIEAATRSALLERAEAAAAGASILIVSDYAKGALAGDTIAALVEAANRHGCRVVIDPKGKDYERYRGAFLVKPNRHELAEASGLPCRTDEEVAAAARQVIERCGIGNLLVTRGAQGMILIRREAAAPFLVAARAREVFDVSGAGDTAIATLAVAIAAGTSLEEAVVLANMAAGISVAKLGTSTCSTEELALALAATTQGRIESKIVARDRLTALIAEWRRARARIGFTNGCFDILHPGHVSLLRQARAACDRLIVGLNSDASVRRLKGPQRPINHERARAIVLASLADVDAVILFEEDTPESLIQAVRPALLVKGADYAEQDVVGGTFVRSYGGQVLLARLSDGFSTTAIVGRMAKPA